MKIKFLLQKKYIELSHTPHDIYIVQKIERLPIWAWRSRLNFGKPKTAKARETARGCLVGSRVVVLLRSEKPGVRITHMSVLSTLSVLAIITALFSVSPHIFLRGSHSRNCFRFSRVSWRSQKPAQMGLWIWWCGTALYLARPEWVRLVILYILRLIQILHVGLEWWLKVPFFMFTDNQGKLSVLNHWLLKKIKLNCNSGYSGCCC